MRPRRLLLTLALITPAVLGLAACGPTDGDTATKAVAKPAPANKTASGDDTLGLNMSNLPASNERAGDRSPMLTFDATDAAGWHCKPDMYGALCENAKVNLSATVYSFYNDAFVDEHKAEREAPKSKDGETTCVDTKDDAGQPFVSCWTPYDDTSVILVTAMSPAPVGERSKDSPTLTVENVAPIVPALKAAAHSA